MLDEHGLEHPSIIGNYRFAYREKHKERFGGSNLVLSQIINAEEGWSSSKERDEAVIEAMYKWMQHNMPFAAE